MLIRTLILLDIALKTKPQRDSKKCEKLTLKHFFRGFVGLIHNDTQGLLNTSRTFPVMIIGIFGSGGP